MSRSRECSAVAGLCRTFTCKQYYPLRDELSVVNGILLKANRIVVPVSMRNEMLERIHDGHMGTEKSKQMAREVLFWPGMNSAIDSMTMNCEACIKYRYRQTKEPMMIMNDATAPWQKVGADLFQLGGKDYLIVIDYYSNYPEVALLSSTSSHSVIKHMKSMFGRHGIPVDLVSDNGPQFSSTEFKDFTTHYGIHHITISPYYAQANGKAEKGVQIIKRMWKKCHEQGSDPYLALLCYRAAPLQCGRSPAQLLMGRQLRTRLPSIGQFDPGLLKSNTVTNTGNKQKAQYDRSAKNLPGLRTGDAVRMRTDSGWSVKGTVEDNVAPRSYKVSTDTGGSYVRNRRDLLFTPADTRGGINLNPDMRLTSTMHTNQPVVENDVANHSRSESSNVSPTTPSTPASLQPEPRRSFRVRKAPEIMDL